MSRYEDVEKKLLSSDKDRKRTRKQKENNCPLACSTLLFSQFSQRIL